MSATREAPRLPPGQRAADELRTTHYGRVPRISLDRWSLHVGGDTADGGSTSLRWADFGQLPQVEVVADHHCAAGWTVTGLVWRGVAARTIVELAPPAQGVDSVLVSAVYGYSSTVGLQSLLSAGAVFATHLDGRELTPERGWPARLVLPELYGYKGPKWVQALEYQRFPQRGFWEQRGYHIRGDAWAEERYSYQE